MIPEEFSQEVIETLKVIVNEFEFEKDQLEKWIQQNQRRRKLKLLKVLEDIAQPVD